MWSVEREAEGGEQAEIEGEKGVASMIASPARATAAASTRGCPHAGACRTWEIRSLP